MNNQNQQQVTILSHEQLTAINPTTKNLSKYSIKFTFKDSVGSPMRASWEVEGQDSEEALTAIHVRLRTIYMSNYTEFKVTDIRKHLVSDVAHINAWYKRTA